MNERSLSYPKPCFVWYGIDEKVELQASWSEWKTLNMYSRKLTGRTRMIIWSKSCSAPGIAETEFAEEMLRQTRA